ncbi:MAG: PH domain-containing protein [Sphingomonadales bacterium]|nr:MAG: PH domain-containing protein [Sphingomonadales bacterium]
MTVALDAFRSSTSGWLRGTLAGWATLLVLLLSSAITLWSLAQGTLSGALWIAPAAIAAALALILFKWIANLAIAYEVTADRLILHKGILVKSIDEIELYRVKDARIDFTIINQMADLGTITITSSDETTRNAPLVIRDVLHARARREKLRELVNAARLSRGVREIDMVHEDFGQG